MKKVLLLTVIICLQFIFISCSNNKSDSVSSNSANSKDSSTSTQAEINAANSAKIFKGIETGDLSMMDNFVSQDIVDHTPAGDVKGLDSVKKMLADIHNHYSNLKFETIADATGGDYHFALVRMTGTVKDNYMGMQPNTPVDRTTVGVVRMVNGKAVEHWIYVDPKEMMKMQKPAMDKGKK